MEKFIVSSTPFLRSADEGKSTKVIMSDLLIALAPSILFAIFKNVIWVGIKNPQTSFINIIYPIISLIVAVFISVACEAICLYFIKKDKIKSFGDLIEEVKVGYGWFPGLFIWLISPVYTPIVVLILSVAVGEIVGKMLFGGFGQNIFNPALVGRAFMAFTFGGIIGDKYTTALEVDLLAGATPLKALAGGENFLTIIEKSGGIFNFITGMIPGSMGETSVLAILIGFIYLVVRKVIDWKVPVIYVGVVFANTLFIGLFASYGFANSLYYALFNVLSGGLIFGAVFMATEPVTSPKTNMGRVWNALMLGVLTVLFRLVGSLPEGVATAIVTMNIFGLVINKYWAKVRVNGELDKKEVPGQIIFYGLFALLFVYNIVGTLINLGVIEL